MTKNNTFNITSLLNVNHSRLFQSTDRTCLIYGGAGAGKSYSVADKLLLQPLIHQKPVKMVVVRKSLPSLRNTCLEIIKARCNTLKIPFTENKNDHLIHLPYDSKILYLSVNHIAELEKVKSLTDVDIAWIEEANELPEAVYDQLQLRLRGGVLDWKQCILSFNPVSRITWLHKRFFENIDPDAKIIHTTYKDNPFLDAGYVKVLEKLKEQNPNLYNVYCLGLFGSLEGTVYTNYQVIDELPQGIKETIIGIDFGFNAPTAVVKIHYFDDPNIIAVEEILYKSGLTNTELITELNGLNIKDYVLFCDSAEPDRIQELRQAGFRCREADKAVKPGIQHLQTKKILVTSESVNVTKEIESYSWQMDKAGNYLDIPVKFNDHSMDAIRYGVFTNKKSFIFSGVGADGQVGEIGAMLEQMQMEQMFNR